MVHTGLLCSEATEEMGSIFCIGAELISVYFKDGASCKHSFFIEIYHPIHAYKFLTNKRVLPSFMVAIMIRKCMCLD